jgi:hypothetical protein
MGSPQADYGGEVWLGSVAADPSGRLALCQSERKKASMQSERSFAGGGSKNGIALAQVRRNVPALI